MSLSRKTGLTRRNPLKARTELARGPGPERRTPIRKRNPERYARLQEAQYGPYGDVIAATACIVTGEHPVDRAHVLGKRSVGAGPEGLAPLVRRVHSDFDDPGLSDARFFERWKVSRADIRAWAVEAYAVWLAEQEAA